MTILGDVVRALPEWNAADLVEKLAAAAPAQLGSDLKDAANILGVTQNALDADLLGQGPTRIALDSNRPLEVLKRARHVLTETERVIRAAKVLEAGRLDEMGTLMDASHASLADDFECSTQRLDQIVESARRGGALGARLTGAGFGGSIVALCDVSNANAVIESIDRGYYAKHYPGEPPENWRAVLHAGPGASVFDMSLTLDPQDACGVRREIDRIEYFDFLVHRKIERRNFSRAQIEIRGLDPRRRVTAIKNHRDRTCGGLSDHAADVAGGHQIQCEDGFTHRVGIDLGADLRERTKQFS